MFTLPNLPYDYSALEPYIDTKTMEIHHTKHHAAYVEKLNNTLSNHPKLLEANIEKIIREIDTVPEEIKQAVINNGGGHANHSFFWKIMSPGDSKAKEGKLLTKITNTFGGFDAFKEKFSETAMGRFGSGWTWLIHSKSGLEIISTANQDSPLMQGNIPIIGIDVWEHAYYLKYQNRRIEYINAWWNVVNWQSAEDTFLSI